MMTPSQLTDFLRGTEEEAVETPWAGMDPNSQHQLWSQWKFIIHDGRGAKKRPSLETVKSNAARFLKMLFGSTGRARVTQTVKAFEIEAWVEGVNAQDPDVVAAVRRQFQRDFVEGGWGPLATSEVHVKILSGDAQDGKPRSQLVVMAGR